MGEEAGGQCKGMTPIQENACVRRQTFHIHISASAQRECAVLRKADYWKRPGHLKFSKTSTQTVEPQEGTAGNAAVDLQLTGIVTTTIWKWHPGLRPSELGGEHLEPDAVFQVWPLGEAGLLHPPLPALGEVSQGLTDSSQPALSSTIFKQKLL